MSKPFGSGNFGEWITDEYGTCDQYLLEEKMPLTNKDSVWGDYRNHYAQTGNYRVVGIPSNFGYLKIRQDEGSCKFLNDWCPKEKQYAGGFGYFVTEDDVVSTFYQEQENFERIFGCGYFRKQIRQKDITVRQDLTVPFGDDPCVLSRGYITNHSSEAVSGKWIEYWGTQMYQTSIRPFYAYGMLKIPQGTIYEVRKEFSRNFRKDFTDLENGSVMKQVFEGYRYPEKDDQIPSIQELNELIPPEVGDSNYEDLDVPAMYVVSLDSDHPAKVTHDGQAFFANEDLLHPAGVRENLADQGKDSFFLHTEVTVEPGQTVCLNYLIGYEAQGFPMEDMVRKYTRQVLWEPMMTAESWKKDRIEIHIEGKIFQWDLI